MKQKKVSPKKTSTSAKPDIEERFQHYVGVIMEDVNSKFKLIMESFTTVATNEALQRVEDEVKEIKVEQQIIKQVLMGHSAKLDGHSAKLDEHSNRLDRIEAKLEQKADKKDLEQLATEIKSVLSNHQERLVNLEQR